MRYRVLRNLGKDLPPYKEGEVVAITDEKVEKLLRAEGLIEPAGAPAERPAPPEHVPAPSEGGKAKKN